MNKKNKMLHRDAVSRAVGFEKMARNMARMLPLQNWLEFAVARDRVLRADGGVLCAKCGMTYTDHPEFSTAPTFHMICNGDIVKT